MNRENLKPFRKLDLAFMRDLKEEGRILHPILKFERKHRKFFMVEIRNNFLDLYFLGHGIEVRRSRGGYYLRASQRFNPEEILPAKLKKIIKPLPYNKWEIAFEDITKRNSDSFTEIMNKIIMKIVEHRKGNISEGVSEINHFFDNRAIGKNGILIIDRQVVYPESRKGRLDLLGLKRLDSGKFTFVVLELKNKNNLDISDVFTRQLRRYIDLVYDNYEHFRVTYEKVLKQKVDLRLLRRIDCKIAVKDKISKRDIQGLVILDNYIIKSDLRDNGLLQRALKDWKKLGKGYDAKLFLKTNVLDGTFFMDYGETVDLVEKYRSNNL